MKTNRNQLKEISKVIELDDNSCLVDLYGEHDENLSKLENNFGIHISYRGNILEFRGESEPCLDASQLVLKIYKKLLKGERINSEMFDNFSKKDVLASADRLNTVLIKTKKKNIYARSSNQTKFVELIKSKEGNEELMEFPEEELKVTVDNTWGDTGKAIFNNWLGLVYSLTSHDRLKQYMDGVDPENPLDTIK